MNSPSVQEVWFLVILSAAGVEIHQGPACLPLPEPLLQFMEDVVRRLTKLESAMVQATESVENESLRFEQSQLTTESMLAQQRTCQVSFHFHL